MDPRIVHLAGRIRRDYARFLQTVQKQHFRVSDLIVGLPGHFRFIDPSWEPKPWGFNRGKARTGRASLCPAIPLADALCTASAIVRGEDRGLVLEWEEENEPWDGDGEAPKYYLCAIVYQVDREGNKTPRYGLAALGGIGVDTLSDPYLTTVKGELFSEALEILDKEHDREVAIAAKELESRPTFAGGNHDH